MNDTLTAAMQIAKRVHALAQQQNESALLIGAYPALAGTLFFSGNFEAARECARRGVEIWRSGSARSHEEFLDTPAVVCLCYEALSQWHFGEIAFCHANIAEAISLAKELNDMHGLAQALYFAGGLAHFERNPTEVERLASQVIELSTRQNFAHFLVGSFVLLGWARSVSGNAAEGIPWMGHGVENLRATGATLTLPYFLGLKAEALHLADRTAEALEAIREAEAVTERSEERWWCAELHRLRGVFLANSGADEAHIEASFCEAIRIAQKQKSVSLEKRAEGTYAEYRRQKALASGGPGFRLPLC